VVDVNIAAAADFVAVDVAITKSAPSVFGCLVFQDTQ
jgi:hypothetical protein